MNIIFPELEPPPPKPAPPMMPKNGIDLSNEPPVQLTPEKALETLERISADPEGELAQATAAQVAAGRKVEVSGALKLSERVTTIPAGWQFCGLNLDQAKIPVVNHIKVVGFETGGNKAVRKIGPEVEAIFVWIKNGSPGLAVDMTTVMFEARDTKFSDVRVRVKGNVQNAAHLENCESNTLSINAEGPVNLINFKSPLAEIITQGSLSLCDVAVADLSAVAGRWIAKNRGALQCTTLKMKAGGDIKLGLKDFLWSPHIPVLEVDSVQLAAKGNIQLDGSTVKTAEIFTEGDLDMDDTNHLRTLRAGVEGKALLNYSSVAEITHDSFAVKGWKIEHTPNLKNPPPGNVTTGDRAIFRGSIEGAFPLPERLAAAPTAQLPTPEPVTKQ